MRLLGVHRWHHRKGGAEGVHLDHLALFRERGWDCAEFAVDHPDNEPSQWRDYFPAPIAPRLGVAGLAALGADLGARLGFAGVEGRIDINQVYALRR